MTIKVTTKGSLIKSPIVIQRRLRGSVRRQLEPVKDEALRLRQGVVFNWRNKPQFRGQIRITNKAVMMIVAVLRGSRLRSGSSVTTQTLWKWLDQTGTRPHIIRGNPLLVFKAGPYKPKTAVRKIFFRGPGVSLGDKVFRHVVRHPGFKPRKFSEEINKRITKDFEKAIKRGLDQGFRNL